MAFDKQRAKRVAKTAAVTTGRTAGDIVGLIFKAIGTMVLLVLTTGAIFTLIFALYIRTTLEPQIEVSLEDFTVHLTSTIFEFDHELGEYVEAVPVESGEVRHWVPYEELNRYLIYAAIAFEDRRFMEHRGVDWWRTVGAFYEMFIGDGQIYGASTITQQLIKNLTRQDEVTIQRKILEIFRAMELERLYTKEEIIEWYLNIFALGGRINGVGAAAQFYYGVDQSELTLAQAASIVGITQFPTLYNPYLNLEANERKRNEVLAAMYAQGFVTFEAYQAARSEPIILARVDGATFEAPIYTFFQEAIIRDLEQQFINELDLSPEAARNRIFFGGLQIYSTVDRRIQGVMDHAYSSHDNLPFLWAPAQSAMVIMDQRTGHIVGIAGRVGDKDSNQLFCMATMAQRPLGSTMKPLGAFGPALELGVLRPNDMIEDAPVMNNGMPWPQNADFVWTRARVNLVRGMSQSFNTVAVRVLERVGVEQSFDFVTNRLHMNLRPEDADRAPLALGQFTDGVTVRESTTAFGVFANGGLFTFSTTYSRVLDANGNVIFDNTHPRQETAVRMEVAQQMTAMLLDAVVNGTGRIAMFPGFDVAGKTGTSENFRDRYFIGYTPHLMAGVWTGFVFNEGSLVGENPAAAIFRQVMQAAHAAAELPPARFQNLPSLTGQTQATTAIDICHDSGLLATDACRNDIRGDRTTPFTGDRDRAPTSYCPLHQDITLCVVTDLLPNSSCETHTMGSIGGSTAGLGTCHIDHEDDEGPDASPTPSPGPSPTDPATSPTPPAPSPSPAVPSPTRWSCGPDRERSATSTASISSGRFPPTRR